MNQTDQAQWFNTLSIVMAIISVVFGIATIWAYVRIVQKAGYSGWNALWMFVPIGNIVMLFVFAIVEWPVQGRVKALEGQVFGPDADLTKRIG